MYFRRTSFLPSSLSLQIAYRESLVKDRIEQRGNGVENAHVESVGDQQEDVAPVTHQPLDGVDVVPVAAAGSLALVVGSSQKKDFLSSGRRRLRTVLEAWKGEESWRRKLY